ncbi:helix-turn-helix domain-containing protein [Amaricoccus sp.]|uniref:AraC-like ligand-binding domain-containing protein n=1 Tax=Amaricoccus sp. TaxID=1872485 RepID=UPI001B5B1E31|nr:AraC family transcriptional regulator [Amaricoccus sp.]MBP7002143.1 AraC family transcriptional regulator [Amaricoccus sp.]
MPDRTPSEEHLEHTELWRRTVSDAYFPLNVSLLVPSGFTANLTRASFGEVSLSRLRSAPVRYEREAQHVAAMTDEVFLVTLPVVGAFEFSQRGYEVSCAPGGLVLERGHEPYRFQYVVPSDLLVMKVGARALGERIGNSKRFGQWVFDARTGLGSLFSTLLAEAHRCGRGIEGVPRTVVGRQLLELLALVLAEDQRVLGSSLSVVRAAHLQRAERYIRANFTDADMSPEKVATACGISTRYLHGLFRDLETTVAQRIRDVRLVAARDALRTPGTSSLSDVAYRFGFTDQAQFSRLFKQSFGETPSAYRSQSLGAASGPRPPAAAVAPPVAVAAEDYDCSHFGSPRSG